MLKHQLTGNICRWMIFMSFCSVLNLIHRLDLRESEKNFVLDEDDYELLQDNNVGYRRPKESKKFKRLKKARADEGQSGFSDEEEYDGTGKGGRSAEDKIKRSLFDDDEGPLLEDIAEEDQQLEEEDGDIGEEEDEMADFIVDEDEVDEHGEPTRRRKVHKKKYRQAPGVSSVAIQEAHDIFGDVDELLMQRKLELGYINGYEEAGEQRKVRLEDEFEPIILSEKYMTENDKRIREMDIPERMQVTIETYYVAIVIYCHRENISGASLSEKHAN